MTAKPEPDKALSFVPQIIAAHDKAVAAQQTGFKQSLEQAIACGELLLKAKETVKANTSPRRKWSDWREEHLPKIPQTTASLYMRLAENKEKLAEISNAVANLGQEGGLSLRKAVGLLPKDRPRGGSKKKSRISTTKEVEKSPEEIAREYLEALAPDELAIVLRGIFDAEALAEVAKALAPHLMPQPQQMAEQSSLRRI